MGGTITNPVIKTDLKQAASSLADEIKEQANQFVEAKKAAADSAIAVAKQAVRDSVESAKKQAIKAAEEELRKQIIGKKDTSRSPCRYKEKTGRDRQRSFKKSS